MLDAAAERGIVEHIDNRAVDIGDLHLGLVAPDRFRPEQIRLVLML